MLVGIYRDLAVGVDSGGADVWNNRSVYCLDAGVGAPPDGVAPQGQSWGLPPFNPMGLKQQAYKPFIDMVRSNMNHCGALRIDHVMGLLRLWWCPAGKTADFGAYVYYPLDDLLGDHQTGKAIVVSVSCLAKIWEPSPQEITKNTASRTVLLQRSSAF